MPRILPVALALAFAFSALAQRYPLPASDAEPLLLCTGCPGNNVHGQSNEGLWLVPYDVPVAGHVGRYVDSVTTPDVQNSTLRTLRAGRVRVNGQRNRVYVKLGSAIGAYDLDTFFTGRLPEPMVAVAGIDPGAAVTGRNPLETAARVDAFIYPEASGSGWTTPVADGNERLEDFDFDDRGYVYYQSNVFGWGIHHDDGRTDSSRLPFVAQLPRTYASGATLFTMKSGDSYYTYHSNADEARLYDVTTAATPVRVATRTGQAHRVTAWAKHEAAGHVAVLTATGLLRVYTYAALIAGQAPLAEHSPAAGQAFRDLAFDADGNLWAAESGTGSTLWQLAAGTYVKSTWPLGEATFQAETLHAGAGHLAIAGTGPFGASRKLDLLLFSLAGGLPQAVETNHYFRNYYHAAPVDYAQPAGAGYNAAYARPFLFPQDGLVYLFYSAHALGDVYELGQTLRPPNVKIFSLSVLTDAPSGGKQMVIKGRNFAQDAVVSFGETSVPISWFTSSSQVSVVVPPHAAGTVRVTISSNGATGVGPEFTYFLGDASELKAYGGSATTVDVRWKTATNATSYEVFRRLGLNGTFASVGVTARDYWIDRGIAEDKLYFYYVRALDAAGTPSANTNLDHATTTQETEPLGIWKGKLVKAVHLSDMRRLVNALRAGVELPAATWTPSPVILAAQLAELRTALSEARAALGLPPFSFTDPSLAGLPVKAVHLQEIRLAAE